MNRRALLSVLGAGGVASLSGCSMLSGGSTDSDSDPPAGSLRFRNDHDLPHVLGMEVTGIGTQPTDSNRDGDGPLVEGDPDVQQSLRDLVASSSVAPGETQVFTGTFTERVWYGVEFSIDGRTPDGGRIAYHPMPPGKDRGRIIGATVDPSGELTWVKSATENSGTF